MPETLRVNLVQPSLAAFRVPVFAALAQRPGIALTVHYGSGLGRENAPPAGFDAVEAPITRKTVLGQPVYWQQAQVDLANRERSDVLVLNWDMHYRSLWTALRLCRRNRVPTVLWGHGQGVGVRGPRAWPRRLLARQADALVFYAERGRDAFIGLGYDPAKLFVAPNALPNDAMHAERDRLRHTISKRDQLLFVSRLEPRRRVDVLLDALATLRERRPGVTLTIIGTGPNEADLRQQVQRLGLDDAVTFAGAIYDEPTLAGHFLASRAAVFPSYMGLSVLHAMSYGLPVVAGDDRRAHGPEFDVIDPGRNGLTFAHNDAIDLAHHLDLLLGDQKLQAELSNGAIHTAYDRYTIKNMVSGLEAAIRYVRSS